MPVAARISRPAALQSKIENLLRSPTRRRNAVRIIPDSESPVGENPRDLEKRDAKSRRAGWSPRFSVRTYGSSCVAGRQGTPV